MRIYSVLIAQHDSDCILPVSGSRLIAKCILCLWGTFEAVSYFCIWTVHH